MNLHDHPITQIFRNYLVENYRAPYFNKEQSIFSHFPKFQQNLKSKKNNLKYSFYTISKYY